MSKAPAPDKGPSPAPKRRRRLRKKLLLALGSFTLVLVLLEIVARLYLPSLAPVRLRDGVYVGAIPLVTGLAAPSFRHLPEGEPLSASKAEGELRVFVFGESSVYGSPLGPEASAPTMLHDLLAAERPGRPVTVVNAGRPGSISANTFYHLLYARRFSPDVVIFYMGMNGSPAMPGEQCAPVRHPTPHAMWRWLVARSELLWTVRSLGPAMLWASADGGAEKQNREAGWDCPEPSTPQWTDILVATARDMGAHVIVTLPVRTAVADLEPGVPRSQDGQLDWSTIRPSYRKLLACHLTPGCDFRAAFHRHVATDEWRADEGTGLSGHLPELARLWRLEHPLVRQSMRQSALAGAWRAAAARHGAVVIDLPAALAAVSPHGLLDSTQFADEIHLSVPGYAFLARLWAAQLRHDLDGAPLHTPSFPTSADVARYWDATESAGAGVLYSYARRGWMLTAVPGLRAYAEQCAAQRCPGGERAAVALGWMRARLGLEPMVPAALAGQVERFSLEDPDPSN